MNIKCAAQHFGRWMIEPEWLIRAVRAVQAGTFAASEFDAETPEYGYTVSPDGVAVIAINGQMVKGDSSFGGTSSIRTQRLVRQAAQDDAVGAIMLYIDSPGGTVAGTEDLVDEVGAARNAKPVHAYVSDLGASAAYWVASQADYISANSLAEIGSIGVFAIVEDTSKAYDAAGVKVHVVSTGELKGAFADGVEITQPQIDHLQSIVDGINTVFLRSVADGRKMNLRDVKAVADGRTMLAADAKTVGLIDRVESFDDAMARIAKVSKPKSRGRAAARQRAVRVAEMEGEA